MVKLTEEQKQFIAKSFQEDKKTGIQIIEDFKTKFEFTPSATTINRYQNYEIEDEEEDDDTKHIDPRDLDIKTQDTRKIKDVHDFSDGKIDDKAFEQLCEKIGKSKAETWELLHEAGKRGYKKVNITTGRVSKE